MRKRSGKPPAKRAVAAPAAPVRPSRMPPAEKSKRLRISDRALATASAFDPYARELQLPQLPGGMRIGSGRGDATGVGGMAMDDAGPFPYQGYLGTGGVNQFSLYFPGYPYLAILAQKSEYRQPVETHAKDMTREWIEFTSRGTSDKSKKIKEIEDRCRELNLQELFRRALIHDGFYGVGHIFVELKGHEDTKLPITLDPKVIGKGQLIGFKNIEPMWCTPVMWNAFRVDLPSFYVPDTWWALNQEMHKTRLFQVISREVPDILKPAYNFGGISMSQLIEPYVDRWLKTMSGVNRLINNFSIIILKTNMSAVLQGDDNGADLLKRLKMARVHGDNTGAFAIDKASEELEQLAVPLSSLPELQQQAVDHMAYPTHLPLVVLTGVTPSGLNASSEGEIEVYHDWNRSEQYAIVRRPLKYCVDIIQLDMYGEIDADIGFEFKPIKQITGRALAEIQKTQAERDVAYVDMGALDRQEVRERVARDPNSGYVNLDIEKLPELSEEYPDEQDETGSAGEREEIGGKPAGELVREAA